MNMYTSSTIGLIVKPISLALLAIASLITTNTAKGDTYTVTNTFCTGAGSIVEAMSLANTNPGTDTITFTADLVVDFRTCPPTQITPQSRDYFSLRAEESVIFEGNGARLFGEMKWFTPSGGQGAGHDCFVDGTDYFATQTPGFIQVGERSQDNSAVTVTVRDLDIDGLSAVAVIEKNASLVMEDLTVTKIFSTPGQCEQAAVEALEGANFVARHTSWENIWNDAYPVLGIAYNGAISGLNAGDLSVENSIFADVTEAGVISWDGQVGSQVNIVTSQFYDAGGISVDGDASGKIVNSIWVSDDFGSPSLDERIINTSSQELDIIASTLSFKSDDCDPRCQTETGTGLGTEGRGWVFRRLGAANINLVQSALGVNFPNANVPVHAKLLDPNAFDPGPGFSADEFTWVMPTALQDAAVLKVVTDQPGLLTNSPGLPTVTNGSLRAIPVNPGELIDRIANSACGQANELINPIDNTCITEDALGKSRVDGNDSRNIGAVQLNDAPHLSVLGAVDGMVGLAWSKPADLTGNFTGYVLYYREVGTGPYTGVSIDGPDTLTYNVTGLTNGTEYEFYIDSVVDGTLAQFPSNVVTATPFGEVGTPVLTVTAKCGSALLEWTQPDLGGHQFAGYFVLWKREGTDTAEGNMLVRDYDTLSTTITGLDCNVRYVFSVTTYTTDGSSGNSGTSVVQMPPPPPIPVLDRLGVIIMALLVLGLGIGGVRRFS